MDVATIEETNRIRLSLGMKPLDGEAASTLESRQAQAYDNYKSHMDAEASKKRREAKVATIRKAREAAQRFALLEGKSLGEADQQEDVDTKSWLMGQKKRQKKIEKARKLEEELAAAEAAAAEAVQYTSKDLAGIQVAHDTSAFLEGNEQILTLKDATIDENEEAGDELENVNLREDEKLSERLELLKKRPGYNFDDDEIGDRSILSQYDEEIYGKKTKKFTLDSDGAIAELSDILSQPAHKTNNAQNFSLDDIVGDAPASSDYLAPSEIKVKKPKKKKSKSTRQKPLDQDDIFPVGQVEADENAMEVDSGQAVKAKPKANTDAFVDDDDLQATLAVQRKSALKKRKKTSPEDIARQLKEHADEPEQGDASQNRGLVIGEISEFVAALDKNEEDKQNTKRQKRATSQAGTHSQDAHRDHPMADADEVEGRRTSHSNGVTDWADTDAQDSRIEEEKTVGEGMGAALALLRERGLIEESQGDSSHQSHHARQGFLKRKRQLEEELDEKARQQRERDRTSGKLERMSRADREEYARQQNTWRDHQHSRKMAELIESSYKPNVQLQYTDDHGRQLDQKEAFKHLSHQFHGKGSGKGKTEKKLKQIDEEKRRESQSLFDASQGGGMSAATSQQLKKRREAGVRLG
ncbi:SART-1 family domain-containing protein [Hirsutella rhossiliensis]|uniref:SART-1 family domain-containing protein n=1 Tax=Hirsutella rhossiliensis TaxID=111463 RepID=A0A9P8N546_9HYPO|nr:SART-1 family domain-containing protein [Hirsutella rhossiliensis]KAH0967030.1 SART-1 family domain-containing protein [Hirsutella rhossiliensis]